MRAIYTTAFVTSPLIGHVTDAVANSPTAPLSGVHSEHKAVKVYDGLSAAVVVPLGFTTIVVVVPIRDGVPLIVASTLAAA
jgi:hypothetical protein